MVNLEHTNLYIVYGQLKSKEGSTSLPETHIHMTATHCNTLQHAATCCNTHIYTQDIYVTATHCNTLQHAATCCNTHIYTYKTFM